MYVDAYFDRGHDRINVVERVDGRREYREFPANYVFYYNDPRGKFQTIYGNRVSRFSTRNGKEFQKELKMHGKQGIWESDINPVFRCLAENYLGVDAPELQTCFFDIEVDFDPERGYSSTDDPFNAITSISLYLNWINKLVTLAVPPKSLSMESAKDIVKDF
jgi:hypothetical protein